MACRVRRVVPVESSAPYTRDFDIHFEPLADPRAVVVVGNARFTMLTSRLLRLEYSPEGKFEDRPSQAFWYRRQPVPEFQVRRSEAEVEIETEHLLLRYRDDGAGFTPESLTTLLKTNGHVWRFDDPDPGNLGGTFRTLDRADGPVDLEPGLVSRDGWTVVDDSDSLVFDDDGWLAVRGAPAGAHDLYLFGYGNDYSECLRDFRRVAGQTPLVPRWALGNWWSRYFAYTADELAELMQNFRAHDVPLSVCIVDMDWHITETGKPLPGRRGNKSPGWTGYTWNRELFPDPPAFIEELHSMGLKVALNLHPAAGVHPHEEQYDEMARAMGTDPAQGETVPFDSADPGFVRAYFEILHHPFEAQGVDFWWIDWQQGVDSGIAGLDPLWWLNHLHYYDLARNGDRRSFIFSRWGGLGNHRYPIGFSGDTVVSWGSLAFQPRFTATAANVGYGWWSHDIGGHLRGVEEAELYARWVQYGVFSPILRLHSTNNPFHERRPWGYDAETLRVTRDAMQLRHALVPYLYSMAWRDHTEGAALIRPMYHEHPSEEAAYGCPGQYYFGSELVAAPFVTPADPDTRVSRQVVWLPPGSWTDLLTGEVYGEGWHAVYGGLDSTPVFARAGAIVPLAPRSGTSDLANPEDLEIHVFGGADGSFDLYEDDDGNSSSVIKIRQRTEGGVMHVRIGAARGETGHLPARRTYTLLLRGAGASSTVTATVDGVTRASEVDYDAQIDTLTVSPIEVSPAEEITVTVHDLDPEPRPRDRRVAAVRALIGAFKMNTNVKLELDRRSAEIVEDPDVVAEYDSSLTPSQLRALTEVVTGPTDLPA
jgi:alpha-glucosidase (family GH31 glycosyl hydrolase)